jgi:hypothetical protein
VQVKEGLLMKSHVQEERSLNNEYELKTSWVKTLLLAKLTFIVNYIYSW